MVDKLKQAYRETNLAVRTQLSQEYQISSSLKVCKRIVELDCFRKAKHIALYQAVKGEIELRMIWDTAPLQGKFCYFPVITEEKKLIFLPATPKSIFTQNRFGILEPQTDPQLAAPIPSLDIIFMPLVGFDNRGMRIGMGQGYYDRTLANHLCKNLIGLAYEFQRIDFIRPEPWDIALSTVITEQRVYQCNFVNRNT